MKKGDTILNEFGISAVILKINKKENVALVMIGMSDEIEEWDLSTCTKIF